MLSWISRQPLRLAAAELGAVGVAALALWAMQGLTHSNFVPAPGRPIAQATPAPTSQPVDIYAADRSGNLNPGVRDVSERVYVPNSRDDSVSVIDPKTFKVVDRFAVGKLPQHVTPSFDLKTLWVDNDRGDSLTPIDPVTAKPGAPVPVAEPYNLYFTPDGRFAVAVPEDLKRLDFRDPHTMELKKSVPVPCRGIDHADFSADGRYALFSCEFSGQMVKVDMRRLEVSDVMALSRGDSPQDVKLSPDGRIFYVADKTRGGVHLIDANAMRELAFVPTGSDAHGLYVSRDSRLLYVSNRGSASVSVISFETRSVATTWTIPGGGTPDMGGVSTDGRVLWLSGRYRAEVYALDTQSGRLLARIPVGAEPHGLSIFPQPGNYSLGHTGVFR